MSAHDQLDTDALDVRLRTVTCEAMKATLEILRTLSDREVLAVADRFSADLERVGYPMPELHFVFEAALAENRYRMNREVQRMMQEDGVTYEPAQGDAA